MARKKVWLFVVEGESDQTAIGLLLESLITNADVAFDVFRADIFGRAQFGAGVDPIMREEDIYKRVRREVLNYLEFADYGWTDLGRIVFIADADGSFVPEEAVRQNEGLDRIQYFADHIEVGDVENARERNRIRSRNLRRAAFSKNMTYRRSTVPVYVYFMSRNLEHVLHDEQGDLTKQRKVYLARLFRSRFRNDLPGFMEFMANEVAVPGDYAESWNYLASGTHSLERGSNLHLLLQEVKQDSLA